MKIVFLPETLDYFNELSTLLYEKGYFGFEESAIKYVNELLNEIKTSLPLRVSKRAPLYFNRYGKEMSYVTFRKNKTTQWYVFFTRYKENGETVYLIRHISNNHVSAQYLIE